MVGDRIFRRRFLTTAVSAMSSAMFVRESKSSSKLHDSRKKIGSTGPIDGSPLNLFDTIPLSIRNNLISGASSPDITKYWQKAVANAIATKRKLLVTGVLSNLVVSSAAVVTGPIHIQGDGVGVSRMIAIGSDILSIDAGVHDVTIEDISFAQAIRYTTTPNTFTAIRVHGTPASPCYRHRYNRVFIDGFQYGILADNICSSQFDINTVYTFGSIWIRGKSANNVADSGCNLNCAISILSATIPKSFGIRIGDGTAPHPEGFVVAPGVTIFGVAQGFRNHGSINVECISVKFDAIGQFGIYEQSSDNAVAIDNNYRDNYFGMRGNAEAAVYLSYATTSYRKDHHSTTIGGSKIAIYNGATLKYGFLIEGRFSQNVHLLNNGEIKGRTAKDGLLSTTVRDCKISGGAGHKVIGNTWNATTGFETAVDVLYRDNVGRVAIGQDKLFYYDGPVRVGHGTAAPIAGTFKVGDRTINLTPSIDSNNMVLSHWLCTVAGAPGTHVAQYYSTVSHT